METLTDIALKISSPAFKDGEQIPGHYTCDGANVNPPIHVASLPDEVESLALIVEDPDAKGLTVPEGTPGGTPGRGSDSANPPPFTHWLMWNITPLGEAVTENSRPGTEGRNSFGDHLYGGPCPPAGEEHRYFFRVFALDRMLELEAGATKDELLTAMEGHVLAAGELMGRYRKGQ